MKIIIKNSDGDPVFTFDVESGLTTNSIPGNRAALEFLRGIETAVQVASQWKDGCTIRDVLIEAGRGANSGNFTITMGSAGENGERGGDVSVVNPRPTRRCTDCRDGTQTLAYTTGPCTTCHGTMRVPDVS